MAIDEQHLFGCQRTRKEMRHVIELWAPWMSEQEANQYIKHVYGLDIYERTETGSDIGRRLGLTNAERVKLKLWPFKPIDATDEQIEEERKARRQQPDEPSEEPRG